jgi:hypothetical protein
MFFGDSLSKLTPFDQGIGVYFCNLQIEVLNLKYFEEKITTKAHKAHKGRKNKALY